MDCSRDEGDDVRKTIVDTNLDAMADTPGEETLAPNEVIDHAYRVVDLLGCGSMGAVYLAEDLALGRPVAVKLVHEAVLASRGGREAFTAEARAMARVRHPNVVTIHAFGEYRGRPYLVMEYVDGKNLAQWRDGAGSPAIDDALAILDPLCLGVQAIHDVGAVHRDLKPANVLLAGDGRIAVTDFGLSGISAARAHDGALAGLGTPAYVSPEVARQEAIDPGLVARIDVYALGVVAFELLTGARPFSAGSVVGLLQQHAWEPPPLPSSMRADLPRDFDAPLMHALDKSPRWRTPSASALRAELLAAAAIHRAPLRQVLLVDDEPHALLALRELVAHAFPGVEAIAVTNIDTAIQIARRQHPDVVVCDLQMPGGGAAPLTVALRQDPSTADIPVIVVTGRGGAEQWRELRALGADRFLVKPIDIDSLAATIRGLASPSRRG
jgi:serine/threonine protein kinase